MTAVASAPVPAATARLRKLSGSGRPAAKQQPGAQDIRQQPHIRQSCRRLPAAPTTTTNGSPMIVTASNTLAPITADIDRKPSQKVWIGRERTRRCISARRLGKQRRDQRSQHCHHYHFGEEVADRWQPLRPLRSLRLVLLFCLASLYPVDGRHPLGHLQTTRLFFIGRSVARRSRLHRPNRLSLPQVSRRPATVASNATSVAAMIALPPTFPLNCSSDAATRRSPPTSATQTTVRPRRLASPETSP